MNQLTTYSQLRVRVQLVRDLPKKYLPKVELSTAEDVFNFLKDEVSLWDREKFVSIMLTSRNMVIAIEEVGVGSLTATIIHPREVFKSAILANASAVILVHNHPSADPTPSLEDKQMTEKLKSSADILSFNMLDHIIIAAGGYSSWAEGWASHTALSDPLSF